MKKLSPSQKLNDEIKIIFVSIIVELISLCSCHDSKNDDADANKIQSIKAEVTVANPHQQVITEYLQLNGVTQFQKKDNIRSNNTGYITLLKYKTGETIKTGAEFCSIWTKEQQALKNISAGDSSLNKFQKPMPVIANGSGVITAVNVLQGDYVAEGDVLATVSEPSSMIVVVNVPYEYHQHTQAGSPCELVLPDGKIISATISGIMPSVDATSQSQSYFIRLPGQVLPENLNVTIHIPYKKSLNALCISSSAIQTDEMQKYFWVMKVVNDSLALKVPVITGLHNDTLTEIISKNISPEDKIITSGSYGLGDSTIVVIKK